MSTINKASVKEKEYHIVVNDQVKSYADEPFFVKKRKGQRFLTQTSLTGILEKKSVRLRAGPLKFMLQLLSTFPKNIF